MFKALKHIKFSKSMYKGFPFMLFLSLLGMAYIANAHKSEIKMRKIQELEKLAEEKRWEYMSVQSDITFQGTESQIKKKVANKGLQPATSAPTLIETN